jgi:hypothetical protein
MRRLFGCLVAAAILLGASGGAWAASDLVQRVQGLLYAGRTADAAAAAEARLAESPGDHQARFALGAVEFLQAVERLAQAFHRYGLSSTYQDPTGMAGLPFLRVPVPANPHPEPMTYDGLRAILEAFVADLAKAEATLAGITTADVQFPLNIGLIRLDLDGDGVASEDETAWQIFQRVGFPELDAAKAAALETDFDGGDVPWLQAYCHLLMAMGDFLLAYDWHEAFDATFHNVFPLAETPLGRLQRGDAEKAAKGGAASPAAPNPDAGIADLVAFIHLIRWPVVAPDRLADSLAHLEAMVRLSRESWRRIMAETDHGREWIPNPRQTGVLPGMRVTDEQVKSWLLVLDQLDALLTGKMLLPHWRFDKGINLRRLFLEPRTFDLVLLVQGSAAIPYLEDGETVSADRWETLMSVFGGDFLRYFVWLN